MFKEDTVKRYLISSGVTFVSGFFLAVAPNISALSAENITWATVAGLVFVGIRAGVKLVLEFSLEKFGK